MYFEVLGELLAPLEADDPLVLHVALVAHENDLGVVPRVGFDLRQPVLHRVEGLLVSYVVHKDEAHRSSVVGRCDCPVSLLTRRVLQA